METITFNYKTKVEQFKEQFPDLYAEIYDLGYMDATKAMLTDDNHYEDSYDDYNDEFHHGHCNNCGCPDLSCDCHYAKPTDDSPRFYLLDKWENIVKKAVLLESNGYTAGNTDWRKFMESYKDWRFNMYIAWNPTHKQFAVESDPGTIDQTYPHLVNAEREPHFNFDVPDDIPF